MHSFEKNYNGQKRSDRELKKYSTYYIQPYIKSNIFLIRGRIAFDHYNFLQTYARTLQNWRQNYWNSQKKFSSELLEKFRADGPYIKSNIFLISGRIALDHYNFLQNYAFTLQNC